MALVDGKSEKVYMEKTKQFLGPRWAATCGQKDYANRANSHI